MRYIFKVLVLSLNSDFLSSYISQAVLEEGEDKDSYVEWYKEVNNFEDSCDLEIDTIIDVVNADYDALLPLVDGIIYFLNPLIQEEVEFFEMIFPIIKSVKRNIPIILVYNNGFDILPLSVNELLENLWIQYPDLEGFANLSPRQFNQVLQCSCSSMISGDTPLNIENAWMRFPIFIQLANIYFKIAENEKKPEYYYYAAQAIKKSAMIADIFNKDEFFNLCDKAAHLYSKVNLYLEASKILENVDKRKSTNYKKLYAEAMLSEGNKLFNRQKYELAAKKYLSVAQWSAIELKDPQLMNEAFRLAINSWISACKIEFAFQILDSLPHDEVITILTEVAEKIEGAIKYLSKEKKYFEARDQLYKTISIYQRENLKEQLDKFTKNLEDILITILELHIGENDPYSAKQTYDEIENLWEAYDVKKSDIDKLLGKLTEQFLNLLNFGMASIIINKITSLSVKKKLTKLSSKTEDQYKEEIKQKVQANIQRGLEIVSEFILEEDQLINQLNEEAINEANAYIQEEKYLKAANHIKSHANYLKGLGKEDERYQILSKSLDILLVGKIFNEFFLIYNELSETAKKKYLQNKLKLLLEKVKEISIEDNFEENIIVFEKLLNLYREQLLYEQSKQIGKVYIDFLIEKANKIIEEERDQKGIDKTTKLIRKISDINAAYLDKATLNFDDLYKVIFTVYTEIDGLSGALASLDKIENKMLKEELHKTVSKLDDKKREKELRKVDETYKEEQLRDMFSDMKMKAQSAIMDRQSLINQRKGYRAFLKNALTMINNGDFTSAIKEYETSIENLIRIKRYDLASVSLAIISLLLIKENRSTEIKNYLVKFKSKFSSLGTLISEIFAYSLVDYIVNIISFEDEIRLNETIALIESLPLFEEEIQLLYSYLGKPYKKETTIETIVKKNIELNKLKIEIEQDGSEISKEKKDIARRKLMKNQYWRMPLEDLSKDKLKNAYLDYFDTITKLIEKKFEKEAAVSLIVGTAIIMVNQNFSKGKDKFYETLTKLERFKSKIETLPEIKLVKELFILYENQMNDLFEHGLDLLIEKLVLFEPEIELLNKLRPKEKEDVDEDQEILTREDLGKISKSQIKLDQDLAALKQMRGDVYRERMDFLNKRKPMRRRYYNKIIELLDDGQFKEAGVEYFELAKSMVRRKDLQTASLMMLLHGLSFLKAQQPLQDIRSNIKKFLDLLGLNKKLIQETFYIRCINFILFVKMNKVDKYLIQIQDLLEAIPIFEEEQKLIDISGQN